MWLVHPLDKNTRVPNGVIGCIVRDRYPGMVKYKGTDQHAENWKHYAVAPDPLGEKENLLERINADFWASIVICYFRSTSIYRALIALYFAGTV